jgi:TFIIH basal transcription factor complex TTD-A subunit
MVHMKRGVLIRCDPAMRQFLKHLDETKAFGRAFIIKVRKK